jgi:hypothetical protein
MFRSVLTQEARLHRRVVSTVVWLVFVFRGTIAEAAAIPQVDFDISHVIECQELPASPGVADGDKIIVAPFRVSVLLREGDEADIEQMMITLVSPARRLRVVDFAPRTELATDVVGNVETVHSRENEQSLSASIGGAISGAYGPVHVQASPSAGTGSIERELSKETFHRLPEKKAFIVSGTTNYEHGVFFKLKPSPQASLEGTKDFMCQFVVPATWRGDWAVLTCQATTRPKSWFAEKPVVCGEKKIFVGLHLAGDAEARDTACRLPLPSSRMTAGDRPSVASRNPLYVVMRPFLGPLPSRYTHRPDQVRPGHGSAGSQNSAAAPDSTRTFQAPTRPGPSPGSATRWGLHRTLTDLTRLSGNG